MASATTDTTRLEIEAREPGSSRETRRLRRAGKVPGVLYGRGRDPLSFLVDARELRNALAKTGAVVELNLGGDSTPAVLKDAQRHPVRGEIMHVDMLRVDLNKPIASIVPVVLEGAEDSPGAKGGGIVEHVTREVNVEALPNDVPESIVFDASNVEVNDTIGLDALEMPANVTLLDETEDVVLLTVTPPRLQAEAEDEIEAETEVVGEGEDTGDDAGSGGEGDGGDAASDTEETE